VSFANDAIPESTNEAAAVKVLPELPGVKNKKVDKSRTLYYN
jgi:hypothetical protein